MRRRPNSNDSISKDMVPRGFTPQQVQEVLIRIEQAGVAVCSTHELVPYEDFLDMVYSPEAKRLHLECIKERGGEYMFALVDTALRADVYTVKDHRGYGLSYSIFTGRFRPGYGAMALPRFNTLPCSDLNLSLLREPVEYDNNPILRRDLHEKYGRHIVAAAREHTAHRYGMERVKLLFKHAQCARHVKLLAPEIFAMVSDKSNALEYFKKTKAGTWAGKLKLDKQGHAWLLDKLGGDKWQAYKDVITRIDTKKKLLDATGGKPAGDHDYEYRRNLDPARGTPLSDIQVLLYFNAGR